MHNFRKFSLFLLAALLIGALAFGLDLIATHVSPFAAIVAGFAIIMAPLSFKVPSYRLGVAATAPVDTPYRTGDIVNLPIAANTKIWQGSLVAKDADGRAVPASATAGLRVVGRAEHTVDNTGGAAGALDVNIRIGIFRFANSSDNALTAAAVGKMAIVEDDQTVASTAANFVSAGRVMAIDSDGVWIDTRFAYYGPKTVVALTSTNGTADAAADLAALKAEAEKIGDDIRALHASLFG